MPQACREYITCRVGTSRLDNFDIKEAIIADVQPLIAVKRVGCFVSVLYTVDDIENENLDQERVLELGGGRLPLIFVNVTSTPRRCPVLISPSWRRATSCACWASSSQRSDVRAEEGAGTPETGGGLSTFAAGSEVR